MPAFSGTPLPWTKLPFEFDPRLLQSDVASIPEAAWKPHFNAGDYLGEWSSVSLRSKSGRADDILPDGTTGEFVDTPLLSTCRHLREAVRTFAVPLKAVRLLRLHAGSRVKEHTDRDLGLADGELRIHVPVVTSEQVEFVVADRRLPLREGESWFIDFSQPHRIDNGGTEDRIHLVIDGTLNGWAENLLAWSARHISTETFVPAGMLELDRFRELVYDDADLRAGLLEKENPQDLMSTVLAEGAKRGFRFRPGDVEALMGKNRREWNLRLAHL